MTAKMKFPSGSVPKNNYGVALSPLSCTLRGNHLVEVQRILQDGSFDTSYDYYGDVCSNEGVQLLQEHGISLDFKTYKKLRKRGIRVTKPTNYRVKYHVYQYALRIIYASVAFIAFGLIWLWGNDYKVLTQLDNLPKFMQGISTRYFIMLGADPNLKNHRGNTPLAYAAHDGCIGFANALLDHGADVNRSSAMGKTPLMIAVDNQHIEMVNLLIERGADVHCASKWGETALHKAAYRGNVDIVNVLLDHGANINAGIFGTITPLQSTIQSGSTAVAKLLIEKGADINVQLGDNETLLHYMIAYWSNSFNRFCGDESPELYEAAVQNQLELAQTLIDAGIDVNAQNDFGSTALHQAIRYNNIPMMKLLIRNSSNIYLKDKEGNSPISLMVRNAKMKMSDSDN